MENYFKANRKKPYHLSIGAVVIDHENRVCCHFFKRVSFRKAFEKFENFYILMRETMEIGEKIEDTLHRGLMEEFGVTGDIITYIGAIKCEFPVTSSEPHYSVEKTTLYFLVKMKTFKPELRSHDDPEGESEIQWQSIDFLISKMPEQGVMYSPSLDESSVLEKTKKYIYENLDLAI